MVDIWMLSVSTDEPSRSDHTSCCAWTRRQLPVCIILICTQTFRQRDDMDTLEKILNYKCILQFFKKTLLNSCKAPVSKIIALTCDQPTTKGASVHFKCGILGPCLYDGGTHSTLSFSKITFFWWSQMNDHNKHPLLKRNSTTTHLTGDSYFSWWLCNVWSSYLQLAHICSRWIFLVMSHELATKSRKY